MKIIKMILKGILTLIILSALAGVGSYFYDQNEKRKRDHKELSYATEKKWQWHDKYYRIQVRGMPSGKSMLRKVNLRKGYVIHAYKNEDYSLSAIVKFVTSCSANTIIETSEKFSDGTSKELGCNEKGDALIYTVKFIGSDTDFTWEESLGGFSYRVNFDRWDFSKLDQEVTLAKAQ